MPQSYCVFEIQYIIFFLPLLLQVVQLVSGHPILKPQPTTLRLLNQPLLSNTLFL